VFEQPVVTAIQLVDFGQAGVFVSRRRTKAGDVDYELSADELQRRELARLSDAVLCERSLVREVLWRGAGVNA
jgi:hypothetical protein